MKKIFAFVLLLQIYCISFGQDIRIPVRVYWPGNQFKLVGQLGEEMGDTLSVRGKIVEGYYKGHEGGPNLLVQMIRDSAIQDIIQIPVSPYWGEFGGNRIKQPVYLPKLVDGATYRLRVHETGSFVGHPTSANLEWQNFIATTGFYFSNRLIVISGEKIEPIEFSPADFVGRYALLSGTSKNENDSATIQTSSWKLKLIGSRKWTESETGKPAEVFGKIERAETNGVFNVENGSPRLVRLNDQLGKTVKLRGIAWSLNRIWWFNYRGTDIYVENMDKLAGWKTGNHGQPVEISGVLGEAELPDINQISIKQDRDLKKYFIVRNASWAPIKALLTPELQIK